jgi:hypothetical protein
MEFKKPEPKTQEDILKNSEVEWFIKIRKFKEEDFHYLSELATFDKNMLIGHFHNSFQFWDKKTESELERLKSSLLEEKNPEDTELLRTIDIYVHVTKKYDVLTVDHLNRLMEELK